MNLKKFRTIQVLTSSAIFLLIFSYFFFTAPFKITEIQLSFWGAKTQLSWLWNSSLILLSVSMFSNILNYIQSFPKIKFKNQILVFFLSVCFCLFTVGLLNMNYRIHNPAAFYYFFMYPLAIFLFAHFNYKNLPYKVWRTNIIYAVVLIIVPLSIIRVFHGMAISEILHSSIIMLWNIWILKETK